MFHVPTTVSVLFRMRKVTQVFALNLLLLFESLRTWNSIGYGCVESRERCQSHRTSAIIVESLVEVRSDVDPVLSDFSFSI
jgi:hypothetical protein